MMADELAYYELSCMGNPLLETPNMDRFGEEGIRFTQPWRAAAFALPRDAA